MSGFLRRGWVFAFEGVTIRHRLRFDYTGTKGSASRLPPEHPPWLVSGIPDHRAQNQKWFRTAEEALEWAQGEMLMRETKGLG